MSNPYGEQDLIGNVVTANDLLNSASTNFPVVKGSGLPTTYVPGAVTFTSAASSNVYSVPYAESLICLVSLTSGTATAILNTGATSTALTQAGTTGSMSDTNLHAIFVSMPSAAVGSTTPAHGLPTSPFFSVSLITSGCQINQLAVIAAGRINLTLAGADWPSVRAGGINAVASGVVNSLDTINPPTNLVGSGAYTIGT